MLLCLQTLWPCSKGETEISSKLKIVLLGFKYSQISLVKLLGVHTRVGTHTHNNLLITQKIVFSLGVKILGAVVSFIFRLKDEASSESQMNLDWKQAETSLTLYSELLVLVPQCVQRLQGIQIEK